MKKSVLNHYDSETKKQVDLTNVINYVESYLDVLSQDDIQKAIDCNYFSKHDLAFWHKIINYLKLCDFGILDFSNVESYFEEENLYDLNVIFDCLKSAIEVILEFGEGQEIKSLLKCKNFNHIILSGLCVSLTKASKNYTLFFYD